MGCSVVPECYSPDQLVVNECIGSLDFRTIPKYKKNKAIDKAT